jgi:hypothetical protein
MLELKIIIELIPIHVKLQQKLILWICKHLHNKYEANENYISLALMHENK